MTIPILDRIEIFPIKSLDGVGLDQVAMLPSGALRGDRQYAIVNAQGQFINGKSTPLIHQLRATFSPDRSTVTLQQPRIGQLGTYPLSERSDLEAALSHYFDQPVAVQENTIMGFPDDLNAPGPTIISTETLNAVAQWFQLDIAEIRRRFRTNLEIRGVPPFWEDRLYGETEEPEIFHIGSVQFLGINPCQRCIVPTRDTLTGNANRAFQKQFIQNRKENLPAWAIPSRFNHFYKLAVNTRLATTSQPSILRIGNVVQP